MWETSTESNTNMTYLASATLLLPAQSSCHQPVSSATFNQFGPSAQNDFIFKVDKTGQAVPRIDSPVLPIPVMRNTAEERTKGATVSTGKSPITLDQNHAEMEYMPGHVSKNGKLAQPVQ